jgi:hypothetical protein
MKPGATEYSQYILYNVENYRSEIHNTSQDILTKFTKVIIEYMRLISEKIKIKNKQYYIFIFERGIETLIHIFSMIFYYTKNLDLTFYHTQKAYFFYIEFIEQIYDDNVTFLRLSSRDALMFVYKKTIFDINNDHKKSLIALTNEEQTIISYVDAHMPIYKKIVSFILHHSQFKYENKLEYINICCDKIQKLVNTLNKYKIKNNYIECIYLFTNLLANKQIETSDFFEILEDFIKQLKERKTKKILINEKNIINKIYDCDINNYISENGLDSLIDYILIE